MPNSSLKCRLKYLMVLNPVRSAISFTLHVVAFSNWAARFNRMERMNCKGVTLTMACILRFNWVLLIPTSKLRSPTEYSGLLMFFLTASKAFSISFSSIEVVVMASKDTSMDLRNIFCRRSFCSMSWRMRTCSISQLNGFEI